MVQDRHTAAVEDYWEITELEGHFCCLKLLKLLYLQQYST